jgi:hypothetical protein
MEAYPKGATLPSWVLYLVGVVLLEALFLGATGQRLPEVPQLTLVASTLVIAVSLHPLRLRLRDYIEGRLREGGPARGQSRTQATTTVREPKLVRGRAWRRRSYPSSTTTWTSPIRTWPS